MMRPVGIFVRFRLTLAVAVMVACIAVAHARVAGQERDAREADRASAIDKIFSRWARPDSPGCLVAVSERGRVIHSRGYGMANLEHGIPIGTETIFEAGSVSKQFTSAAIALLTQDGKLSPDDPVRKYVPELPDFGAPILIRHFLNHTSGIRSQWPLLTLAGRPPGSAVHTIPEILELVAMQRELNFKPGEEYLYNNTAFTLLGVIVARVSGQSLNDFTTERLFKPLGMTHTQWRDDFTRIVRGRATAYSAARDGSFRQNMPFTNVVGNGGLLTTAEDLLKWNANLDNPKVGGRAMVEQMQTRGRLNDGFENEYAQGLIVGSYKGLKEVSHGGSTAGYRAFLARYPDQQVSVALLCNVSNAGAETVAHQVADVVLGERVTPPDVVTPLQVHADALKVWAGVYREMRTDAVLRVTLVEDALRIGSAAGGVQLVPIGPARFVARDASVFVTFTAAAGGAPIRMIQSDTRSNPRIWDRVDPFTPSREKLEPFIGSYYCPELDVTYDILSAGGALIVRHRPAVQVTLVPAYADAFDFGDGRVIRFTRDGQGRVDGFRVFAERVRHLQFVKR